MSVGAAQQQQVCLDPNAELASRALQQRRQAGQNQLPSQHPSLTCPRRLHISRRYGCPLRRTPRASDGRLVLAGLLARGSIVLPSLPGPSRSGPVADMDKTRRLQLRGQPRIESDQARHRVPFSPARVVARSGTSTLPSNQTCAFSSSFRRLRRRRPHCTASRAMPSSNESISASAAFVSGEPLVGGRR